MGAGNASGVHPYSTALNILWKKYSIALSAMLDAAVLMVLKAKMESDMRSADSIMVCLRLRDGTR